MTAPRRAAFRRVLLVAGLVLLAAGLVTFPAGARQAAAAPAAARSSQVTVQGPRLYNGRSGQTTPCHPATACLLPRHSSVTVSQTQNLTGQLVRVSWAHFTPSNLQGEQGYDPANTLYAVMVAECPGTHPVHFDQCYGVGGDGTVQSGLPDGPDNVEFAVTTGTDGTGTTDISLETKVLNPYLGCDQHHPCSLVVVPGQGGNYSSSSPNCSDHSLDGTTQGNGYGAPASTFYASTSYCSWNDKIVIPLHFAPVDTGCPSTATQFQVAGSPMMYEAMLSWQAGLCGGASPVSFLYDPYVGEPQALRALNGLADVALTTRPASADSADGVALPSSRHYIYAPVAVSAVSIAYWIDNFRTHGVVTDLRLDERLVEKLITFSYPVADACPGNPCDPAVTGDPASAWGLFQDPEFASPKSGLDPGIPDPQSSNFAGAKTSYIDPIMLYGNSDMTWTLTRWLAANPESAAFLRGTPDPWGMHVNKDFRGSQYPTDIFENQDSFGVVQRLFEPQPQLSNVGLYLSLNEDAGKNQPNGAPPPAPPYTSDPPEQVGQRALLAITDAADAATYGFPVAALGNAAGHYMQPTDASMAAALQHMTSDGSGTLQVDLANTDPAAYPLTMVIYAAVPTAGTPHAKAAAIASFLDFAAGAGQTPGVQPGQLPAGYLPLPAAMQAQTRQAASEVADQTGNPQPSSSASPTPTPTPAPNPSLSGKPTKSPSLTLPKVTASNPPITTTTIADPQQAPSTRYILPAVLMLGGLSALAGSSTLMASRRTNLNALLARAGRSGLARSRRAWGRLGQRRQP